MVLGIALTVTLGPMLAGMPLLAGMRDPGMLVQMLKLASLAVLISVGVSLAASFFPAWRAARLDPCATFQEI